MIPSQRLHILDYRIWEQLHNVGSFPSSSSWNCKQPKSEQWERFGNKTKLIMVPFQGRLDYSWGGMIRHFSLQSQNFLWVMWQWINHVLMSGDCHKLWQYNKFDLTVRRRLTLYMGWSVHVYLASCPVCNAPSVRNSQVNKVKFSGPIPKKCQRPMRVRAL